MSGGNTPFSLPQQFWQHGNLTTSESAPWAIECAISDEKEKAKRILEKIDERWPASE
jgi:hypothetical protein